MADLFDDYELVARHGLVARDEVFEARRVPRPCCSVLHDGLQALSWSEFDARAAARDARFLDQGITFSLLGEERPFPLDLVPRIIADDEWAVIEAGVVQRVRALEAFLADVYGPGDILREEVVPRRVVTSSKHFHRAAAGVDPANGVRVHIAGIDIVRGADGRFRVLEDNLRTPSGLSYVIENRRMMARVFPELFASHRVRPVEDFPAVLLAALRAAAPARVIDPTVVVLTPGVYNSAYFEHAFLAQQMGVELVEGRDLVSRDNRVWMRTTDGERQVDVIYRRVDDDFLDPLHFRADSLVGCAGVLNAARGGAVTIANAVGNGVADDKLLATYVPDIIRFYLREEPVLPDVETYRLEEADSLALVLDRVDELVIKPVDGSGGYGIVVGPDASAGELEDVRAALRANPRGFIAQELVMLSTSPTQIGHRLVPCHVDLRPFAVNDGNSVTVLPGGLTRVAMREGSLVVNSSQGGGSKDTWVLAAEPLPDGRSTCVTVRTAVAGPMPAPAGSDVEMHEPLTGPMLDQTEQQQQQQQQQIEAVPC